MKRIYFAVAAPKNYRWVISKAFYNLGCFVFDNFSEPGPVGVICGGEHEILPNHYSQAVAGLIEFWVFIITLCGDF